jgi:hypothetical protein
MGTAVNDYALSQALERERYDDVGVVDREDVLAAPSSWRLLDDVEIMSLPDPAFLIDGVLPRRAVGALVAPSGVGKTTLAVSIATSLATGREWFGHRICHRGATVCGAAEDPGGFKLRIRAKKVADHLPLDQPLGVYTFPEGIDLRDPVSVAKFSQFLERAFESGDPARELLIIDTYAAAMPGANENASEDTTTAMAHAFQWRDRLGVTVLLIHHTNASGTRERGHSAMRGAADFMIEMRPEDDVVKLECSKMRNGPPFETLTLKLTPVPEGGRVFRLASDVLPSSVLSPTQTKVLTTLADVFSADGATKSEWQRACADVPDRSFHRAAKVLQERGLVKQIGTHFRVTGSGK